MPRPIVVSFYTDEFYKTHAERLRRSCCGCKWPHRIIAMPDQGGWVQNCGMKAKVMLAARLTEKKRPVLWIDADGEIVREPTILRETKAEFAVRAEPGKRTKRPTGREIMSLPENWPADVSPRWFNSGTIFFSKAKRAVEMLERWVALTEERPNDWDQWTLQQAWADVQPQTLWLPQGYCRITRMHRGRVPPDDLTCIRHELASTQRRVTR